MDVPDMPQGWGCGSSTGHDGIPVPILCMSFFDVHETLKKAYTEDEFVIEIGQIPESAAFDLMMNTYNMGIELDSDSMLEAKKRFMANPKLLTESQRVKVSGDPN
jgi:hypothetical protein